MTPRTTVLARFFVVMFVVAFFSQAHARVIPWYKSISPQESVQLIQNNKDNPEFVILDVRTSAEVSQGRIKNSIQLDFYSQTFSVDLQKLDKEKIYLVYCRSGNRSGKTLEIMRGMNFKRVYNMTGGIRAWNYQRLPITL